MSTNSEIQKVKVSGSSAPPHDNGDLAPSGLASENTAPGKTSDGTIADGANASVETGPGAKGKLVGFKKAQEALMKALEGPHASEIAKALDTLEKAVPEVFTAELEKSEAPAVDNLSDIRKAISDLTHTVSQLVKAQAQAPGSELQKAGFVEVSAPTPKPSMAQMERQPSYSQGQSEIVKQVTAFEETGAIPDFQSLANNRLKGVLD